MDHSVERIEGGTFSVRRTRTIIPARNHIDEDEILCGMAADRVYIGARVVLGRIPAGFVQIFTGAHSFWVDYTAISCTMPGRIIRNFRNFLVLDIAV